MCPSETVHMKRFVKRVSL